MCTASPMINIPHQNDRFVTFGEPTLAHQNHPKSIVYIGGHSVLYTLWVYKGIMTYKHPYGIIQGSFTALKILYALPIHPPTNLSLPDADNHGSFLLFP